MHHYTEFDPYLIRERNQQIFGQVKSLRLEKRLRKNHAARDSRLVASILRLKSTPEVLRKIRLAGR